jgi:hypothetical protein
MIPMYEPLEAVKCNKCGKIIAEPRELIRIVNPRNGSPNTGSNKDEAGCPSESKYIH